MPLQTTFKQCRKMKEKKQDCSAFITRDSLVGVSDILITLGGSPREVGNHPSMGYREHSRVCNADVKKIL